VDPNTGVVTLDATAGQLNAAYISLEKTATDGAGQMAVLNIDISVQNALKSQRVCRRLYAKCFNVVERLYASFH